MRFGISWLVLVAGALHAQELPAQSVIERTPNLSGAWTGAANTAHFNFMHRFQVSDDATRKVTNSPNFLIGYSVNDRLLVGANYATSSDVAPAYPNEWEFFARAAVFEYGEGGGIVAAQAGYNIAATSLDAELSGAHQFGPVRLIAGGRAFTNGYFADETRFAVAAGALLRFTNSIALAGDVVSLLDRAEGEETAWGAALQIAIPYTPHSLSLQAANTRTGTLQGSSRGNDEVIYGFEFTIPLTLSRYFGGSPESADDAPAAPAAAAGSAEPSEPVTAPAPAPVPVPAPIATPTAGQAQGQAQGQAEPAGAVAADTVYANIRQLAFAPAKLAVKVGTTVIWTNRDPVAHTVTATGGSFDSGLIGPGKRWSHTFRKAGSFAFTCTPHPFMRGVVEVTQ